MTTVFEPLSGAVIPDGVKLERLDYVAGYLVKTTPTHRIELWRYLVNWRLVICRIDEPGWPEREWCYAGLGPRSFITAVLAANVWDGADDTEPAGFFRRAPGTMEPRTSHAR